MIDRPTRLYLAGVSILTAIWLALLSMYYTMQSPVNYALAVVIIAVMLLSAAYVSYTKNHTVETPGAVQT